jgi:polyhydroxyalkanoate synthesis regulator phasin
MEKITLKLKDVLQLESEINGFINPETGERHYEGFVNQNLSIVLKYDLNETTKFLENERKKVNELRDELVKKYGEKNDEGRIFVNMYLNEKNEEGEVVSKRLNPKYLEFDKEYAQLLDKEIEVEYPEITKEDLKNAGKSKDNYFVLFRLIKNKEVK